MSNVGCGCGDRTKEREREREKKREGVWASARPGRVLGCGWFAQLLVQLALEEAQVGVSLQQALDAPLSQV